MINLRNPSSLSMTTISNTTTSLLSSPTNHQSRSTTSRRYHSKQPPYKSIGQPITTLKIARIIRPVRWINPIRPFSKSPPTPTTTTRRMRLSNDPYVSLVLPLPHLLLSPLNERVVSPMQQQQQQQPTLH